MKLLYESAVRDESGLVLLRSRFKAVGRRKGFQEVVLEKIELVCNEIVTNQMKHAKGSGMVQIWDNENPEHPVLDIFAMDYGPGIEDLEYAKQDGTTTTGTMGRGLGAIERLSSSSEIYTQVAGGLDKQNWHGTAVWSRFGENSQMRSTDFQYGVYLRALRDDFFNGDEVQVRDSGSRVCWAHLDGLGHGKEAAEAIAPAQHALDAEASDLYSIMNQLDRDLSLGRGAVVIAGDISANSKNISISGVGDMSARIILNGELHNVAVASGVMGHDHRSIEVEKINFPRQALFISTSDGIRNWNIKTLPHLWRHHPQMIAFVMGQVLGRNNDDKSIFIVRRNNKTANNG